MRYSTPRITRSSPAGSPAWLARSRLVSALVVCLGLAMLSGNVTAQSRADDASRGLQTWVSGSAAVTVRSPPDGAASQREVSELAQILSERDEQTHSRISYWDAGAPNYRWNQIATRHGLEANLLLDNYRLITYLNVAIYDALVAANDVRQRYDRPRPSQLDPELETWLPVPDAPSYPSDHAVAAGAAETVLRHFLPDREEVFTALAEEAANAHVLAGLHFPSDAAAGLELGREVGALVIERAMADNADAEWTGTRPEGHGIFAMESMGDETVAGWETWLLTSASEVRSPPPPAPDSAQRAAEIAEVRDYPRDENPFTELFFWPEDPAGRPDPGTVPMMSSQAAYYYAPFNHLLWLPELNQKVFEYRLDRDPLRAARAYALVSVAFYDATAAVWDGRFAYWVARPIEWDDSITTVLTTYNTPEYPSGHTGLATATAEVMAHLFPDDAHYFRSRAAELGESRIAAGIHFRSAVDAGAELGRQVAARAVAWDQQDALGTPPR